MTPFLLLVSVTELAHGRHVYRQSWSLLLPVVHRCHLDVKGMQKNFVRRGKDATCKVEARISKETRLYRLAHQMLQKVKGQTVARSVRKTSSPRRNLLKYPGLGIQLQEGEFWNGSGPKKPSRQGYHKRVAWRQLCPDHIMFSRMCRDLQGTRHYALVQIGRSSCNCRVWGLSRKWHKFNVIWSHFQILLVTLMDFIWESFCLYDVPLCGYPTHQKNQETFLLHTCDILFCAKCHHWFWPSFWKSLLEAREFCTITTTIAARLTMSCHWKSYRCGQEPWQAGGDSFAMLPRFSHSGLISCHLTRSPAFVVKWPQLLAK